MKDLEVELILANSAQAKGRVERKNGTLQDRLVKEMRLRGVTGVASANKLLEGGYLDGLNERFAVEARRKRPDLPHIPDPCYTRCSTPLRRM